MGESRGIRTGLPEAAYVESAAAYAEADLLAALRTAGLTRGEWCSSTSVSTRSGPLRAVAASPSARGAMVLRVLRDAVGETGTLVLPAYTFSFCRQRALRRRAQRHARRRLEHVRRRPGVRAADRRAPCDRAIRFTRWSRSGRPRRALMKDLPPTCFGEDCLQHRLRRAGAQDLHDRLGPHEATMVLHAEVMCGVPFRFKKLFTGEIREQGRDAPRRLDLRRARALSEHGRSTRTASLREATRRGVVRQRGDRPAMRFTSWTRSRSTSSCVTRSRRIPGSP